MCLLLLTSSIFFFSRKGEEGGKKKNNGKPNAYFSPRSECDGNAWWWWFMHIMDPGISNEWALQNSRWDAASNLSPVAFNFTYNPRRHCRGDCLHPVHPGNIKKKQWTLAFVLYSCPHVCAGWRKKKEAIFTLQTAFAHCRWATVVPYLTFVVCPFKKKINKNKCIFNVRKVVFFFFFLITAFLKNTYS